MSYKFAIIGCGRIAQRHAANIQAAGATLLAACDINSAILASFTGQFGCAGYSSISALLKTEKPDVVVICTPNGLHAAHSISALEAGFHVLCEKPMAISTEQSWQMLNAAEKSGCRLFVVKQNRYNPPVAAVRKLIDEHKLGQIHSFQVNCFWNRPEAYYSDEWHGTISLDGGILFTQFSHFIDLLYWFLGDVAEVIGFRENFLHQKTIEFEDTGTCLLKMASGAIGSIQYTINSFNQNMEGSISLFGEKGTVKIGGQYLNELDYFQVEDETLPSVKSEKPPNRYGFYEGSMSNHDKIYEHLLLTLKDPAHQFVEAEEAMKTVEIIEKIYQASGFQR